MIINRKNVEINLNFATQKKINVSCFKKQKRPLYFALLSFYIFCAHVVQRSDASEGKCEFIIYFLKPIKM